jgi:hypothetical protein
MITTPQPGKFTAIIPTDLVLADGTRLRNRPIRWTWSQGDPYALHFTVCDFKNGKTASMAFSRTLLAEGRDRAVGELEVHVRPNGGRVIVDLHSKVGRCSLDMAADDVEEFLRGTFRILPLEGSWEEELIPLIEPPVAAWAQEVQK